jgi:hypothetical protein
MGMAVPVPRRTISSIDSLFLRSGIEENKYCYLKKL